MLEWLDWNCSSLWSDDWLRARFYRKLMGSCLAQSSHCIVLWGSVENALDMNLLLVIWNMSESHYYLCSLRAGCQDLVFWNNRKLSSQARSKKHTPLIGQFILNTGLWLVKTGHVTWILASDWSEATLVWWQLLWMSDLVEGSSSVILNITQPDTDWIKFWTQKPGGNFRWE